ALLREPGHVEHGDALALDVRGHAHERADRDHAGAADAGDDDAPWRRQRRQNRFGKVGEIVGLRGDRLVAPQRPALDGDDARTEAGDARVVLVARELVDRALAAELGVDRHHRQAVRFRAAVAAALADQLVDEHARRRVRIGAAFAPAPLLGSTGLVVDEYRDAAPLAQFALHRIEILARPDLHAGRKAGVARIVIRVFGEHDD